MVDLFQATTREELLYLCQLALQDHPPLLKRNFVEVSQNLSGSQERKIRFMTWNTLADALCNGTENFIKCPKECLNWHVRKFRCVEEILMYNPDIICLQEVDHFADFFQPLLHQVGYVGCFNPKPDSPCLDCVNNAGPDGCAMFYKVSKFNLVDQKLPILEVERRGTMLQTNQVAILSKLKYQVSEGKEQSFLVATTHLKAKTGWESLRLNQGCNLIDIAKEMSKGCPLIIGGDFNAVPSEPVYKAFVESKFESAYKLVSGDNSEPLFTTWKIRPRGEACHTIDYIWLTKDNVQPVAYLQFPTGEEIGQNRLPSWEYPSDHLSLVCDFVFSH